MLFTLGYKITCVKKYQTGEFIKVPADFNGTIDEFYHIVAKWTYEYERYGKDEFRADHQYKQDRPWEEKLRLVQLINEGALVSNVSKENGIEPKYLERWVKRYRDYGVDGLKFNCINNKKMKVQSMTTKEKDSLTQDQQKKLKELQERNEYLESENEYLKKLRALEKKKEKAAHPRAKKQKSSKK